jgi:hypothetical protein
MVRIAAIVMLAVSGAAHALDSLEFQLYGVSPNGVAFDIRPYCMDTTSEGDVDEPDGVHGEFCRLVGTENRGTLKPVGSCSIRHGNSYAFICEKGKLAMSGAVYEGRALDSSNLRANTEARTLYRAFIAKYKYGALGAVYRCKEGCTSSRPRYLIYVQRGD